MRFGAKSSSIIVTEVDGVPAPSKVAFSMLTYSIVKVSLLSSIASLAIDIANDAFVLPAGIVIRPVVGIE